MEKLHISFQEQISKNKRNSVFLIFLVFLVLIALTYIIARIYSGYAFIIYSVGIIFTISYLLISYYNSASIALASVNAKEADITRYRQYHNIVEGLSLASGLPKPKLYIMNNNAINAFASGRDPRHSVICVTTGALEKLNKHELEGVIAHELSHIANYDIRFITLVAVMVGLISIIAEMFLRSLWMKDTDRDNKAGAILMIIGLVLAILAPIFVQLVQFAISRKREYAADANGVKFTRYPKGLADALKKIKYDGNSMKVSAAVSPLFMSDPSKRDLTNLFATHPPLEKRIEILEKM